MSEILVHAPGLRLGGCDRDILLSSEVEEVVAAGETVIELGKPPWGNDFDGGLESIESEFKSDLIIPFASTSVRDSDTVFLLSDRDLRTGDYGACKRCS